MTTTGCRYCGLPFKVRRVEPGQDYFCCTGCAILARVPVDADGQFPVNRHLVGALVTGFLYFNQLLFWLLAILLARDEGGALQAGRFAWLSAGAGGVVWLTILIVQLRERAARASDFVVAALVLASHALAASVEQPSLTCMAAANALFLLWSLRGVLRRRRDGKRPRQT
jgi:hypothetical protein